MQRFSLKPALIALFLLTSACTSEENSSGNNFLAEEKSRCQLAAESKSVDDGNYNSGSPLRIDIRDDAEGLFMHYNLRVVNVNDNCKPVAYAVIDIWQANVNGLYSDKNSHVLRGRQNTGPFGEAQFMSVFPGWNTELTQGVLKARSSHVNFKIHVNNKTVLTSEFYFSDEFTKQIYSLMNSYKDQQQKKYKRGNRTITLGRLSGNKDDFQFKKTKGEPLLMELERVKQGYKGTLLIGVGL